MRPHSYYILDILKTVAADLMANFLPKMQGDNDQAEILLKSFIIDAVAEELENSAHNRIEENNAIRKIFSMSLPVIKDDDLKTRMESALKKKETDWRLSKLANSNCELLELLIELQTHVEILEDENSRDIEKAIWEELKNYTKRRELMIWETSQAMMLEGRKTSG